MGQGVAWRASARAASAVHAGGVGTFDGGRRRGADGLEPVPIPASPFEAGSSSSSSAQPDALPDPEPTCALCGGRFAPSDRIVMQGMVKMHEACMTGSKPAQCNGPRLPPARALKDAPATLVIKLALAPTKVATFYVARIEQEDDELVSYEPDPAARAPPKRRVDVAALAGATVRALSLQGAEVAPATTLDGEIAPFRWTAQGLNWHFDVRFDVDATKNVVAVDGAELTVVCA